MADKVADKVKQTAVEEAERVKTLATDAAKSGAYLYPIRGLLYFIAHRSLWKPLQTKLAPTITLGLGVTTFMFTFTYLPQAAVMTLFEGPIAPLSTILLVLSESSTLINMLSKSFLIDDALIDTFDGTLVSKDQTSLVSGVRQVKSGSDPIYKLGKLVKKPFTRFTPTAIIKYLMYLPLNFIPVVGTILFIILQAKTFGPNAHDRYFHLKGFSEKEREEWVEKRRGAYTSFGIPAMLLELVPIAGIFFSFTNQVGAALWAADLEKEGTTAPGLREKAKKAS